MRKTLESWVIRKSDVINFFVFVMSEDSLVIKGKVDGFGAQLLAKMTGIAYCRRKGLRYLHAPFSSLAHDISPHSVDDLEEFGGMGRGEVLFDENSIDHRRAESHKIIWDVMFCENPDVYYTPSIRALFREKYYGSPKTRPRFFKENMINVCLHVRRGDVNLSVSNRHRHRYTDNEKYIEVMNTIGSWGDVFFHVFSNGDTSDLDEFREISNSKIYLNSDIKDTFHALVASDVLVSAKSAFSYSAALLGSGVVVSDCMTPFLTVNGRQQCRPLLEWKNASLVHASAAF